MNWEVIKNDKYFIEAINDDVAAAIIVIDKDKHIKQYNNAVIKLFDANPEEFHSKKLLEAIKFEICEENEANNILEKLPSGPISGVVSGYGLIKNEKRKFHLNISYKPLELHNEKYYILIIQDITKQQELQQKLIAQNEKLKRDLLLAKGIQNGLLPEMGQVGPLDLAYIYRPCEALGGDFIDFYRIDKNHIGLILADVSGHGLAASMFTMFLYSQINRQSTSPSEVLKKIFNEFSEFRVSSERYITMFCVIVNTRKHTIKIANAGFNHPPIIVNKHDDNVSLECSGIPISNWVEKTEYEEFSFPFVKGDRLVFFSDGITETIDKENVDVGPNLLVDVLSDRSITAYEVTRKALYDARLFNRVTVKDDITMGVVDFK